MEVISIGIIIQLITRGYHGFMVTGDHLVLVWKKTGRGWDGVKAA
jgi:hypothetical protein